MTLEPVHPRNLTIAAWRRRIKDAQDPRDLLRAVDDFLATWQPDEIARLPEGCRPGRMRNAGDVRCYALQLARREFAGNADEVEMLRMSGFFSIVSRQLYRQECTATDS